VPFAELEAALQTKLAGKENPMISVHADKAVAWGEVVRVMNIAKNNNYTMIMATSPE
jgi:biopolymer transport protein ExbD